MFVARHVPAALGRYYCKGNNNGRSFSQYQWRNFGRARRRQQQWLRVHAASLASACARKLEFLPFLAARLWGRLWKWERPLLVEELLRAWRRRATRDTGALLAAVAGGATFDWERETISREEVEGCYQEIDSIHKLRESTVVCPHCHLRLIVDKTQQEVKYCCCYNNKAPHDIPEEWKPYIECKDMIVWRKADESSGLYAYKIYGSFADVTAQDFLQVQIDVDYRKIWDQTAKELKVIESDPNAGNNEIIYWEMVWPILFANREYVYQRKWIQDDDEGVILIISKSTHHPSIPNPQYNHRVSEYWSYIVIKPYEDFQKEGIEFSMTYFDDPGVNIPSAFESQIASWGFPDYLCRMREATKDYKRYLSSKQESPSLLPSAVSESQGNVSEIEEKVEEKMDKTVDDAKPAPTTAVPECKDAGEKKPEENDSEIEIPENQGFLSYFFFMRLFA